MSIKPCKACILHNQEASPGKGIYVNPAEFKSNDQDVCEEHFEFFRDVVDDPIAASERLHSRLNYRNPEKANE